MWNTFKAHQLLDFALSQGKQHPLKLALFDAHFTQGRNVSDRDVLVDVATEVGLDPTVARQALEEETFAASVRDKQALWQREGISGVPSMIFKGQFLVTGAQGAENYARLLTRLTDSAA
jgi:predicted DsbA family dithiol-disulfide isomerase